MEKNPFKVDTDIDVDALMFRIRESAKQRGTAVAKALSPKEPEQRTLQTLQPQRLTQEIHSGVLSAEVINEIPLKAPGTKGRFEFRVKKFLKWLVHWNTKGQAEFNHSVMRSLGLIAQDLQTGQGNFATVEHLLRDTAAQSSELERKMNRGLEEIRQNGLRLREQVSRFLAMLEEVEGRCEVAAANLATLEQKVGRMIEESAQHLRADFRVANATLQKEMKGKFDHELDEFRMRILRVERIARNASRAIDAAGWVKREYLSDPQPDSRNQRTIGKEKAGTGTGTSSGNPFGRAFDYFLFEDRHRGSVSDIKRRQSIYLDLFRGKEKVLDLGCGRGEFVELLSENVINVTGVDSNEDMVDFCRDRGLPVVQADIFEYLTGMPDEKFDGIFLAQVVEHLPPEQILELVGLCAEKLEPGGVIVIETPNTNCPEALGNFYLDPTHVRPVPAEMLRFILEQAPFQIEYLRFSSPLPGNDLSEVLDAASGLSHFYQDYAVVASRR